MTTDYSAPLFAMDHDPLDSFLDRLNHAPEPPPNLRQKVWRRIARSEEERETLNVKDWMEALFLKPAFVLSFVGACIIAAFIFADHKFMRERDKNASDAEFARNYRRMIDPMLNDSARASRPEAAPSRLDWLKSELQLTDEQYAQIKTIHERTSPHLIALATQVAQLRNELAAFEEERRTEGRIDFLEFARWVDTRRSVDRDCLDTTRNLVLATANVMNETQRARYLGLIGPAFTGRDTLH